MVERMVSPRLRIVMNYGAPTVKRHVTHERNARNYTGSPLAVSGGRKVVHHRVMDKLMLLLKQHREMPSRNQWVLTRRRWKG